MLGTVHVHVHTCITALCGFSDGQLLHPPPTFSLKLSKTGPHKECCPFCLLKEGVQTYKYHTSSLCLYTLSKVKHV